MRALELDDISAALCNDQQSILMLNVGVLGVRYLSQMLVYPGTRISSRGGLALPAEVWHRIISFARGAMSDKYCFAVAECLEVRASTVKALRCRPIELNDAPRCGYLSDSAAICDFERLLEKPASQLQSHFSSRRPGSRHTTTSSLSPTTVLFTKADKDTLPAQLACLFADICVPDVISFLEEGQCGCCGGDGFICPGCGGMGIAFGVFMGCGVSLACPLCIGLEFAQDHKTFLKEYYSTPAPEDEQRVMDDLIRERFKELGYPIT